MRWAALVLGMALVVAAACGGGGADRATPTPSGGPDDATASASTVVASAPPGARDQAVALQCGNVGVWSKDPGSLHIGPVILWVPWFFVDNDGRVAADWSEPDRALIQKLPMSILADVGTPVTARAVALEPGASIAFEYPNETAQGLDPTPSQEVAFHIGTLNHPAGEPAFIPGVIHFSDEGCYQLFVTVDRTEYGPFGLRIVRRKPS